MTKKEVKEQTNEQLILILCRKMACPKILKGNIKDAELIIDELHNRKVIDKPDLLKFHWVETYKL